MTESDAYEYDEHNGVVIMSNAFPFTLDDSILLCEHLIEDPRVPEEASFLIDLRCVPRLLQFEEIYQLVSWHKSHGFPFKGRFAFLVDRPATIGTANIFCSLLQLHAVEAEMFDDQSLALGWLANAPRISGAYPRRGVALTLAQP